jgi:ABC-type glycerol-3-phosphate transport system substrate-binding protein
MTVRSKPVLVSALCLVLALGVAACGSSSSSSSSSSSGSTSGNSETGADQSKEVSGTLTTWDYEWDVSPGYRKAMKVLDPIFEKEYPNVKLERVKQPIENYYTLVQAAFTAHEGPDIMMLTPGVAGVGHYSKGLTPLNDLLPKQEQEELSGWEFETPGYAAEGERFALPVGLNGDLFYYNKKMFKEAGLPTDFQPKTWDEVKEAGEKLEAAGIQAFSGGNKDGVEVCGWETVGWQSTNTYEQAVELMEGTMPWTDKAVEDAFQPMLMMEEAGLYHERFAEPYFLEGVEQFGEEKGAMTIGLAGAVAYWGEYGPKIGEENLGVFFPPESNYQNYESNTNYAIPDFAKNQAAAVAYLEFLGSKHSIEVITSDMGTIPNHTGLKIPADAPPIQKEIVAKFQPGEIDPYLCGMFSSSLNGLIFPEIGEVLQGRKTLPDALNVIQEAAERETPGA